MSQTAASADKEQGSQAKPARRDVLRRVALRPVAPEDDRVHGPVRPADVRVGDPIFARLRIAGTQGREVESQVWRISPLAVEIVKPQELDLDEGMRIDLRLRLGRDVATFGALPIAAMRHECGRTIIAARWCDADAPRGDRNEARAGVRWRCAPEYVPTGMAPNPLRYEDHVLFRVAEISRSGMRLVTSLRNKHFVPGATFDATCAFPAVGETAIAFRVVHAQVAEDQGKQVMSVGVTWSGKSPRAAEVIGQYLLEFGPGATLEQLRAEGFRVRASSRAFEFGSVYTDEEYREVLELRRIAYVHAKKISDDVKEVDMADDHDAHSRILFARYRGRMVATLRVSFPGDSDRLKHEDYCKLPDDLPPRAQMTEASKACTHPDFRGSDLFYSLVKHAALITLQARRRYVLMSCTESLVRVYQKLGLKRLGVEYLHPSMHLKHHVLLADIVSMAVGGMNPFLWNVAIGPEVWAFANLCGVYPESRWRSIRLHLTRLLKPFAPAFIALLRARARREDR